MAHLHDDDENRFTKAVLEGIDAATRVEINKSAQDLRKDIGALNTRLDGNEQAILATVKKIARRLDALEKTETAGLTRAEMEALIVKQKRAAGVPESCL